MQSMFFFFFYIHLSPLSSESRVLNLKCVHGDFMSLNPLSTKFRSIYKFMLCSVIIYTLSPHFCWPFFPLFSGPA